jgi:Ca2+-binding RTX toxin-like protein
MKRTILLLATMALTLLAASGVALAVHKVGTNGPDTLRGTNSADNLIGKGGNDVLFALAGRDHLVGGEGKDWLLGGNERRSFGGDKTLVGGPGNDGVQGGLGADTLLGASGDDFVHGDYGSDRMLGEEGKDFINGSFGSDRMVGGGGGDFIIDGPFEEASKDYFLSGAGDDIMLVDHVPAYKDVVSCGGGFDRIVADTKDVVADDCERVRVVHGTKAEAAHQEGAFFDSLPPAQLEFISTFFDRLAPDPTGGLEGP